MPLSAQSQEDLSWILKEIVDGGGDGAIAEVRFLEGLSDKQILALFHNARKSDYEKLIQETNMLIAEWSSKEADLRDPAIRGLAQLSKLQRRLDEIVAIDFFQSPERLTAELQFKELRKLIAGQPIASSEIRNRLSDMTGKTWVTRSHIFVDRIACGWLIRRFVDNMAAFKFVSDPYYLPKDNEICFDMFDGEYTHEGDRCTFEVMIQRLQIQDPALGPLAEVVHDIDLKDGKFGRNETDGINALLTGMVAAHSDDDIIMQEGFRLFENLYAYYQRQKEREYLSDINTTLHNKGE